MKPPAKNKSTRKQANQNLKQTTCLSHNNYWIMQILTKQTKQGASISGRKASKEKAVIGKSDLLFLLRSCWEKVDQDWHLLASLMGCTYWSQSLGEQNTLVGWFCITGLGRRQWLGKGLAGGLPAKRLISGRSSSQEWPPICPLFDISPSSPGMFLYSPQEGTEYDIGRFLVRITQVPRSRCQLNAQ